MSGYRSKRSVTAVPSSPISITCTPASVTSTPLAPQRVCTLYNSFCI
jgi:hypothetical protein